MRQVLKPRRRLPCPWRLSSVGGVKARVRPPCRPCVPSWSAAAEARRPSPPAAGGAAQGREGQIRLATALAPAAPVRVRGRCCHPAGKRARLPPPRASGGQPYPDVACWLFLPTAPLAAASAAAAGGRAGAAHPPEPPPRPWASSEGRLERSRQATAGGGSTRWPRRRALPAAAGPRRERPPACRQWAPPVGVLAVAATRPWPTGTGDQNYNAGGGGLAAVGSQGGRPAHRWKTRGASLGTRSRGTLAAQRRGRPVVVFRPSPTAASPQKWPTGRPGARTGGACARRRASCRGGGGRWAPSEICWRARGGREAAGKKTMPSKPTWVVRDSPTAQCRGICSTAQRCVAGREFYL